MERREMWDGEERGDVGWRGERCEMEGEGWRDGGGEMEGLRGAMEGWRGRDVGWRGER